MQIVVSHRKEQQRPRLLEINVSSLNYIPLPRAPLRWEEKKAGKKKAKVSPPKDFFDVQAADWKIITTEKVPRAERPDPAFRLTHPTTAGLFMVDDLGKADGLGSIEAAALRYDQAGNLVVKSGLKRNLYRLGVHPLGHGLIAMSRDGVIHAYDDNLEEIFETSLVESPEVQALRTRFSISDDQLKNHIRCVALSKDASRYLFTAVDEAWCMDIGGHGLWGIKLPFKEGWTRIATPSSNFATSAEISNALAIMNTSFPFSQEDLKHRYRELAKQWHPDYNPNNPHAEKKMKEINLAMEALTGLDVHSLPKFTGASFVQDIERIELETNGIKYAVTMGMGVSEIFASDWIYAASFAAGSNQAYLAGYSGRVVLVDEQGAGVRVFDIGSVPRRIVDTGDYLYFLTDTRLYVLRGETLHAVIDTFEGGDLIIAQTGFGLIEKNRLRWFKEDGTFVGSVVSKDPIRRAYWSEKGMIVESRQHRAIVQGVPKWWE